MRAHSFIHWCVCARARQAISAGKVGKRGPEVKAEPDEEPSSRRFSKAGPRSPSDDQMLPGPNRASGAKGKAMTTPDAARDSSSSYRILGFEVTTKQIKKAVTKLNLSISTDSSNDTIKLLVSFSLRVCMPLSGVAC